MSLVANVLCVCVEKLTAVSVKMGNIMQCADRVFDGEKCMHYYYYPVYFPTYL